MAEKTEYIYHYTDFNALKGIVENKELWLSNILNSNDSKELSFFYEQLINPLLHKVMLKEINFNFTIKKLNLLKNYFAFINNLNARPSYALCFTSLEDDVSQWERYSNNAKGVMLGFNKNLLLKILPAEVEYIGVHYDGKLLREEMNGITVYMESFSKNITEVGFFNFLSDISKYAIGHKHKSFQVEAESRIFIDYEVLKQSNSEIIKFKSEIIGNSIKEYCCLDVKKMCKEKSVKFEQLIDNITIGPRSSVKKETLRRYLLDKKLNKLANNVKLSNCPLQ